MEPIEFIDSPDFHRPDAEQLCLSPAPPRRQATRDYESTIGRMAEPPFTKFEEQFYFRKMNYLKYRAEQCRLAGDFEQAQKLMKQADQIRGEIVLANLGLISLYGRFRKLTDEQVSDAILKVFRCVDKFNHRAGKFSTYTMFALRTSVPRATERFHRARVMASSAVMQDGKVRDLMAEVPDYRHQCPDRIIDVQSAQEQVAFIMPLLTDRERDAVSLKFGLNGEAPHGTEDAAYLMQVARSRIAQLINKSLERSRRSLSNREAMHAAQFYNRKRQLCHV